MFSVDVVVFVRSCSVAAPGVVEGLHDFDACKDEKGAEKVEDDAEASSGVFVSEKVVKAESDAKDGVECQEAKEAWLAKVRVVVHSVNAAFELFARFCSFSKDFFFNLVGYA